MFGGGGNMKIMIKMYLPKPYFKSIIHQTHHTGTKIVSHWKLKKTIALIHHQTVFVVVIVVDDGGYTVTRGYPNENDDNDPFCLCISMHCILVKIQYILAGTLYKCIRSWAEMSKHKNKKEKSGKKLFWTNFSD